MTAANLSKIRLYLAHARFRGQRALANDNEVIARKLLHELDRPAEVTTREQLDALGQWAVIRDGDGWVCEKQPLDEGGVDWFAVKSTRVRTPALGPDPVVVLQFGDEEES